MKKMTLLLLAATLPLLANFVWYQDEQYRRPVFPINTIGGSVTEHVANPAEDNTYSLPTVTHFEGNGQSNPAIEFTLINPLTDLSDLVVSLALYADADQISATNGTVGITLGRNDNVGSAVSIYKTLAETKSWQTVEYDFSSETVSSEALAVGGYDQLTIEFSPQNGTGHSNSYYIYEMNGTTIQNPASPLAGSWGVTYPVFGGSRLDYEMGRGLQYLDGVQEIIDSLPATGHVITNLTYFAHAHLFTFRDNANVDVASEIHPDIVPSAEGQELMLEVIRRLKQAGKKVILYYATGLFSRADADVQAAWENYYTTKFNGDEYAAYRKLSQGFFEQTKDLVDGYWLDNTAELKKIDKMEDFINALREIDPDAMIAVNDRFVWTMSGPQEWVKVDSDGLDDEDTTDYLIVEYESLNDHSDYTCGHVTPQEQGAPVNSWAYDELTITNMEENNWSEYNNKPVLKHGWFPIRELWHVPTAKLVYETEQAYRFVRRITDAGAAVSWATTTAFIGQDLPGHMMRDEMAIMKEINRRLMMSPQPDYEPYVRPEGAYLVGEQLVSIATTAKDMMPIQVNFTNNTLHFNQNFAKAEVFTVNGRRVAEMNTVSNMVKLNNVSTGVYVVNVEFSSGVKQNFRVMFK